MQFDCTRPSRFAAERYNSGVARRCLLVLTKPPIAGRVKTRLIGRLTADQAAELHRAMTEDVVTGVDGGEFEVVVAWDLEDDEEAPQDWPRPGLLSWRQPAGDLGDRLFGLLARAAERYEAVAAVGTDHPGLGHELVEAAFAALESSSDVVLGPALDGGYYLVGVRRGALGPRLFAEIDWSTERVFEQTLERCGELGLSVHRLQPHADVDTSDDLSRLQNDLLAGRLLAPATARLLASWSRLTEETA